MVHDGWERHQLAAHHLKCGRQRFLVALQGLLFHLENSELYSCSSLAALALTRRMIRSEQRPALLLLLKEIAAQNAFHRENDKGADLEGSGPFREWFGLRWKAAIWKKAMQSRTWRIEVFVRHQEDS